MLVCIGLPFYNVEDYLDDAILSIINQSYTNWKLLLLNDGSTDRSLEIAMKYKNDVRIEILSDGENRGLIYRLNELISKCDAKYFARMDADDVMHPNRLEKQIAFLEKNLLVDIVGSWAYSIDTDNNVHGVLKTNCNPRLISDVFKHACFIHPSIIGRTDWFKKNEYSADFIRVEDEELWTRTILESTFVNLAEPLLFYREVGIPYLRKYLKTMSGERKLIHQIYADPFSIVKYKMLVKNYAKSVAFTVFSVLHLQNYLIKRRSERISFKESHLAKISLNKAVYNKMNI